MANTDTGLDPKAERQVAVALFNRVWSLLEKESRTPDEDDQLVHAAHASTYHWMQVGTAVNHARGEWQCSRVYAVLGRPEASRRHARRCLDICESHGLADFDLGFAYEALARAYAIDGDHDEAGRWLELARDAAADVAEDEDRDVLLSDLETIPTADH